MAELPRQSDGLPLFDLITAVEDTRRAEHELEQQIRPLVQAHGRARGELAAEIVRGLLAGDEPAAWTTPLKVLGIEPGTGYGWPEQLGREFAGWFRWHFVYGREP